MLGWSVGAHEVILAQLEVGVHDLPSPIRGNAIGHGRILMGHHDYDFAAQATFVKLEGGLALAVEVEVGIQLHTVFLCVFGLCVLWLDVLFTTCAPVNFGNSGVGSRSRQRRLASARKASR